MKNYKMIIALLILTFSALYCFNNVNASAAVKTSLKNGTFTVSGKGSMKSSMIPSKKQKKKIKKVNIMRGVTKIPPYAFDGCKKLNKVKISNTVKEIGAFAFYGCSFDTITIPNSVKKMGSGVLGGSHLIKKVSMPGDMTFIWNGKKEDEWGVITGYDNVDTIICSTNLNLSLLNIVKSRNITLLDSDDYSSENGGVYTKDGTILLRVLGGVSDFVVSEKCKIINASAFTYVFFNGEEDEYAICNLSSVVIPESVERFDFKEEYPYIGTFYSLDNFIIKTQKLPEDDMYKLAKASINSKPVIKGLYDAGYDILVNGFILIDEIRDENGSVIESKISKEGKLAFHYYLDDEVAIVPDCVEEVSIFNPLGKVGNTTTKKVIMGKNVKRICNSAFVNLSSLEEVELNDGLESIGDNAFMNTGLTSLILPQSVKSLGIDFIYGTKIKEISIPKGVENYDEDYYDTDTLEKIVFE